MMGRAEEVVGFLTLILSMYLDSVLPTNYVGLYLTETWEFGPKCIRKVWKYSLFDMLLF